jgi:hypothetical protein
MHNKSLEQNAHQYHQRFKTRMQHQNTHHNEKLKHDGGLQMLIYKMKGKNHNAKKNHKQITNSI